MNVLHINSNYNQSSIYSYMAKHLIGNCNIEGRVYYPVSRSNSLITTLKPNYLDISVCLGGYDRYFFFYRNQKLLKNISRNYDLKEFDLALGYSLFSNGYLAYSVSKYFNIPYLVIVQNTDINYYFKKFFFMRNIGRRVLFHASKVIFLSVGYKDFLLNKYIDPDSRTFVERKSVVIPFGIDEYWFSNLFLGEKKLNNNELKLLFVGRVNHNKNIRTTIEACELLIKKGIKLSFTVVGPIEDEELGRKLQEYEYITYHPKTNKESLLKIYRENDMFIMPSINESFGLVYAEAMSQKLPLIYTRGQGFDKQFREGEVGFSVDCFNAKEIAEKIVLIQNDYTRLSNNCTKLVYKFKWNDICTQYCDIFDRI